jgi:hypothetical protein
MPEPVGVVCAETGRPQATRQSARLRRSDIRFMRMGMRVRGKYEARVKTKRHLIIAISAGGVSEKPAGFFTPS